MPTSYTPILKLALPANGELSGTWGTVVNDNITSMIEEAIAGRASVSSWSANAATITTANGTTSAGRAMMLDLSGTLTAAGTLTVPTANKMFIVKNGTTGGFAVTVKMTAGSGVSIPNGTTMIVYADGTNVIRAAGDVDLNSTQTLTNKTINGASNTLTVRLASDVTGTLPVANGGTGSTTAATAKVALEVITDATGSARIPAGTQAQRNGSPTAGNFRFNTDLAKFEGYNGSSWGSVGGGAIGGGSDAIFIENGQTVTTNYTITTGNNAGTFGPVTINSGITVTVPNGSTWTVV